MTDKTTSFQSPYRPEDPDTHMFEPVKRQRTLDYIAHYLEGIEKHLGVIANAANHLSEQQKRELEGIKNLGAFLERT